jgi:glycosyltransferase involved in cell wall biosynthesis
VNGNRAGGGPETVVFVTTSYPRFPGDTIATFMEPIARGLAARGHRIHIVLPWHPRLQRIGQQDGLWFHPFRYAPVTRLNVFGYAHGLKADVQLRGSAYAAAPLALVAAWRRTRRVAREAGATVIHGHWVVPSGVIAAAACGRRPLVISLHGSDVFVAERHAAAAVAARAAFRRAGWVTACSEDLRERAIRLGASADRSETIPYGVDTVRFKPDAAARARCRQQFGVRDDDQVIFTAGRFVRKKGFEYLVDAMGELAAAWPRLILVIGGGGDLESELVRRAEDRGVSDRVRFAGVLSQDNVAEHLAAADVAVVPSIRDDAGNVDGLPNVVMEALASATPLVTTDVGGIPSVATDGRTAIVVPQRDGAALARAIAHLLAHSELRAAIGTAARNEVMRRWTWERAAERFEDAYRKARDAGRHGGQ